MPYDAELRSYYKCGDCGLIFETPAEDGLRRDICPHCGSLEITEVDPDVWENPE